MRALRWWIPPGDLGANAVVATMRDLARRQTAHPMVRGLALDIVGAIPGRDARGQAAAIRAWLERNVSFVRDPAGNELLYEPARMVSLLRTRGPPLYIDCDDVAVLAAALGRAVGLPARFVVVGYGNHHHPPLRHVWTELGDPLTRGPWMDLDVTRSSQPLGRRITRRVVVYV